MGTVIKFEDVRPGMTITLREGSLKLKGEVVRTRADLRNISFKTLGTPAAYYVSSDTVITTKIDFPEGTIVKAKFVNQNFCDPSTLVRVNGTKESWVLIDDCAGTGQQYLTKDLTDIKVVGGYVSQLV